MHEKRTTPLYDDNKRTTRIPEFDLEGYKRSRIIAMFVAGAILIGCAWLWVNMQRKQAEESPVLSQTAPVSPYPAVTPPSVVPPVPVLPAGAPPVTAPPASTVVGQTPQAKPADPVAQPVAAVPLPATPVAVPAGGRKNLAATPRVLASSEARMQAGKPDPTLRLRNLKPFPRIRGGGGAGDLGLADAAQLPAPPVVDKALPPPPPPVAADGLVPPPEPDAGLSLAELPAPPSRPSIANKMKLVGVIGDKAIIAFTDRRQRMENKWPRTITLGRGEQFESVSVVEVTPDSVTIDEDGERSVKSVEPLK